MSTATVTTALARIQTDPQGDSPVATAYFSKETNVDGIIFQAPWESVNWPLQSAKEVVVNGVSYSYSLGSQIITAIAYQEYAELSAPPAPVVTEPDPVAPEGIV
jgi:hypothetical protein